MSNDIEYLTAEELEDIKDIEARKGGPIESLEEFLAGLKSDGLI